MTKLQLGHVYDVTKYFNQQVAAGKILGVGNFYEHGYYISKDVWDMHIYRVQVGINAEYNEDSDAKIIEQENISHGDLVNFCVESGLLESELEAVDERMYPDILVKELGLSGLLKAIVAYDYANGFENFDVVEFHGEPLSTLIDTIDSGYGITEIEL